MASRMKVTQRSTTGETVRREIPRGCIGGETSQDRSSCDSNSFPLHEQEFDFSGHMDDTSSFEPSLHRIAQEAAVTNWNTVRPAILKAAIESSALPSNQYCCLCSNEATFRCLQCSPSGYFCHQCFGDIHSKINIFHIGEVFEVCDSLGTLSPGSFFFLRGGESKKSLGTRLGMWMTYHFHQFWLVWRKYLVICWPSHWNVTIHSTHIFQNKMRHAGTIFGFGEGGRRRPHALKRH